MKVRQLYDAGIKSSEGVKYLYVVLENGAVYTARYHIRETKLVLVNKIKVVAAQGGDEL